METEGGVRIEIGDVRRREIKRGRKEMLKEVEERRKGGGYAPSTFKIEILGPGLEYSWLLAYIKFTWAVECERRRWIYGCLRHLLCFTPGGWSKR